jgi:hypothetical protein
MTPEKRLAEAAKQLGLAAEAEELNALQRESIQHVAGLVDALGKSIVRPQAAEEPADLRPDGGDTFDPYGPPIPERGHDPTPDPAHACIDCGREAGLRCGCCGFPLCGRHHEVGGGFCTEHFSVGGVGVCTRGDRVYVGVHPREEIVLVTDGDADAFHLPDAFDGRASRRAACQVAESPTLRVKLSAARENGMELCEHCADAARERHEQFREELAAEMEGDDGA